MPTLKFVFPIALVAALALAGCRALVPVEDVDNAPYSLAAYTQAQPLTMYEYEQAIVRAGAKRNWVFEQVGPGHLVGTTVVRGKHTAVVDVFFDTETFSIHYKDSQNLKWDPERRKIHPNYNAWVDLLKSDIQAEFQNPGESTLE